MLSQRGQAALEFLGGLGWPCMKVYTHKQAYTRTHRGRRCEGPDSVRSIVYNRFTYPQAECDPHSRHHTSLPFSLTNPHTLSCA